MNPLGLIGGTSWHSTIEYYRYINQHVNDHFGNNTNPPLLVFTLNHFLIRQYQLSGNWEGIAALVVEGAKSLERAGAEQVMLCANTQHKVCNLVEREINVPILHIADATAEAIKRQQLQQVCFIGTKYSMKETFITQRIQDHGIRVLTPEREEIIEELHRIIQEELTFGKVVPASKEFVIRTIQSLVGLGCEGVILGCTEFPLMIDDRDLSVPIFNTTQIHALAGAQFILQE
ncbi:aspartate/glutamate racemase family protein [Neolewinella agarilytica]|uniref:Aspartate racemase n=1 Tax=Neolewinella agarilytica TaxID=478744 RepID=A0A1H9E3A2_9BACT|nr:amino acid racemase [Neolewinella agarilytica]SEQ20206.1 aspartate racemase [Neolewinella agarilytica]